MIQSTRHVRIDVNLGGKIGGFDVPEGQEGAVEALFRELERGRDSAS